MASERPPQEYADARQFLELPSQDTLAAVFHLFTPQLVSFFRARGCEQPLSEDLAQEVMWIDRTLFRAWLYKVARSSLCRHFGKQSREIETIDLEKVPDHLVASTNTPVASPAFEFLHWMSSLDSHAGKALKLRFIEDRNSTRSRPVSGSRSARCNGACSTLRGDSRPF